MRHKVSGVVPSAIKYAEGHALSKAELMLYLYILQQKGTLDYHLKNKKEFSAELKVSRHTLDRALASLDKVLSMLATAQADSE